jgi:hypothetical protein
MKSEEILVGSGLDVGSTDYLVIGGTQLVFKKEIVFEKGEIGEVGKVKPHKDGQRWQSGAQCWDSDGQARFSNDGASHRRNCRWGTQILLEEGFGNYNFVGVGSWNLFTLSRSPLENSVGGGGGEDGLQLTLRISL